MTFFKKDLFVVFALVVVLIFFGYSIGMSFNAIVERDQINHEFRDVGYALDYDSYFYNSMNFTKKYVHYDAYADDSIISTIRHGDEIHIFTQKFFSNNTGILEQIPIGSSRCGTGDWLCLYEPPTTVFVELTVESSSYLDYQKMKLNNDRIVSVDWLDIDGDGTFTWVFGFDMEDTWKNPGDVHIAPWMTFVIYLIDEQEHEPEYDTTYYKKVNAVELELMMKLCVEKWIDDCVLLDELTVGEYIRVKTFNELTQYSIGNTEMQN